MPELPEVEILRFGLTKYIKGLVIEDVEIKNSKIFSGKGEELVGSKVVGIRRFGKMLVIDLDNKKSLAIHVKMTGRLIYRGNKQPKNLDVDEDLKKLPGKYTHVVFSFQNGDRLYFNDVRRFGWIKVLDTGKIEDLPFVKKLGPEPLRNLDAKIFFEILKKYSRTVKTLIMDQSRISGVGNIYANEALFCAGIDPSEKSNKISKKKSRKLYDCILKVFKEGMKFGGSSTDSFRDVLGEKGEYQDHYFVYDREGEECRRKKCKGIIKKLKLGGRGTYYCSYCQK